MVNLSPEINMGNIFAENKYCMIYHQTYLATQYLYLIKNASYISWFSQFTSVLLTGTETYAFTSVKTKENKNIEKSTKRTSVVKHRRLSLFNIYRKEVALLNRGRQKLKKTMN